MKSQQKENSVMEKVFGQVRADLEAVGVDAETAQLLPINATPENVEGDFGIPVFSLAKTFRKSPPQIAQELAVKLTDTVTKNGYVTKYFPVGPYVNFELNAEKFATTTVVDILQKGPEYGRQNFGSGEKVIIELSSPNIAKRMSVGHLRSTIIGDAIAKAYSFCGFEVIKDNHLGDWGTQFGHLLYAIEQWGDFAAIEKNPIEELQKLYVKVSAAGEEDEKVKDAGRAWFKKLEDGDPEARRLWQKITDWSLKDFQKIYDILDVKFDITLGESFYEPMLQPVIEKAKKTGAATESRGALVFDLEDQGLGIAILQKSDGATIYLTRDLAKIMYCTETLKADRLIYVVGEDQKLYFRQLFAAAKKMGYKLADHSVHIYFGLVRLPEGKMSTRKGRVIFLEDLIVEAQKRAAAMISGKTKLTTDVEKEKLIKQISVGALKWNDLKEDPREPVIFNWDEMLSLKGNSAPYVQYAYARAASVLEKAGELKKPHSLMPTEPLEKSVVKKVAEFPSVVKKVVENNTSAPLATYLYELAQEYNSFYHELTILGAERKAKETRIALSAAVAQTLKNGLSLLGIEAPEKM